MESKSAIVPANNVIELAKKLAANGDRIDKARPALQRLSAALGTEI